MIEEFEGYTELQTLDPIVNSPSTSPRRGGGIGRGH